jgi:hypothetical protein
VHLGAYAWLEDLRPQARLLTDVTLPPDLAEDFPGDAPLQADDSNEGYLHAPSLNHAVTPPCCATGTSPVVFPTVPTRFAVNLSSARVRAAMALLDGVRTGQGLGDLLGYQFERGLHDRHGLAEVDRFIYPLRKAFPLRADRMASTRTDADVPIKVVEARNVIDGLALVEHLRASGTDTYPFNRTDLPQADPAEAAAISAEARRLLETHDSVADLALAEGVYQAVNGNVDRAAATFYGVRPRRHAAGAGDRPHPALRRGSHPRVAVHLPSGDPAASPVDGVAMTPRAQAEPAVNAWLAGVLPPLRDIGCLVTVQDAAHEVTMDELGLQPVDLLAVVRDGVPPGSGAGARAGAGVAPDPASELDDRIRGVARARFGPRLGAPLTIDLAATRQAPLSLFEVVPLIAALRQILTAARPLAATDLARSVTSRPRAPPRRPSTQPASTSSTPGSMRSMATSTHTPPASPTCSPTPRRAGASCCPPWTNASTTWPRCWAAQPRRACRSPAGASPTKACPGRPRRCSRSAPTWPRGGRSASSSSATRCCATRRCRPAPVRTSGSASSPRPSGR